MFYLCLHEWFSYQKHLHGKCIDFSMPIRICHLAWVTCNFHNGINTALKSLLKVYIIIQVSVLSVNCSCIDQIIGDVNNNPECDHDGEKYYSNMIIDLCSQLKINSQSHFWFRRLLFTWNYKGDVWLVIWSTSILVG